MCGERPIVQVASGGSAGSSPRVRGTRRPGQIPRPPGRFIPACAGNARQVPQSNHFPSVHPRVCGERGRTVGGNCDGCGSSPRVRGTRLSAMVGLHLRRFIPACAGNATWKQSAKCRQTVHPRVCGERLQMRLQSRLPGGSSPRVRGTLATWRADGSVWRFIPACAGNAVTRKWCRSSSTVHPRVCGERPTRTKRSAAVGGSSPRVRGTLIRGREKPQRTRFIPACAGNALSGPWWRSSHDGSSPRVRGTLLLESIDLIVEFQRAGSYRFLGRF